MIFGTPTQQPAEKLQMIHQLEQKRLIFYDLKVYI